MLVGEINEKFNKDSKFFFILYDTSYALKFSRYLLIC